MKKLRGTLILLTLITVSVISFICMSNSDIYNKNLIYYIKTKYIKGKEIDKKVVEKLKDKDLVKKDKSSNDYFVIGYYSYLENNKDKANQYFNLTINNLDKSTDEFAKIFSYRELVINEIQNGNDNKALEYIKDAYKNIDIKEYNNYYELIWDMNVKVINSRKGKDSIIKFYDKVIGEEVIDKRSELFTFSKLGPVYYLNGEYSRAIEANLRVINGKSKDENSNYYKGKAIVDLSVVYKAMGNYEKSKEVLEQLEGIKIKNKQQQAYINTYGIINLAELDIRMGNYEETLSELSDMYKNKKYFTEEDWRDNEIVLNLTSAEAYINLKQYDKAEELINESIVLIASDKIEMYNSKEVYCDLLIGKLFEKRGNNKDAIAMYEKTLNIAKARNNDEYIIKSYNYLINLYEKNRDYEEQIKYLNEKNEYLKKNNTAINEDSAGYVSQKHNYERLAIENIKNI